MNMTGEQLISRALSWDLITEEEASRPSTKAVAEDQAEWLNETWPEDCGFGSSDMSHTVKDFLDCAGFKCEWPDGGGPLQRVVSNA